MKNRRFSLKLYLLIVILLSWPFQIAYGFLGQTARPILLFSMIMVTVATFICGKYIFKDGLANAGWSWGKPKHYIFAFGLPLFLWLVPRFVEHVLNLKVIPAVSPLTILTTFLLSFVITLIPAFGEEFGWRGYLLPRLMLRYSIKKSLLLHGFITWFWHLPVIVIMGIQIGGNAFITVLALMLISFVPTILHAVVFAYFWSVSKSLAVATVYHAAFDETRDTLQETVGFGPLVEIWQMVSLTIFGIILLLKARWK